MAASLPLIRQIVLALTAAAVAAADVATATLPLARLCWVSIAEKKSRLAKLKARGESSQPSSRSDPRKLVVPKSTVKSPPMLTAAVAAVVAVVVDCDGSETSA